MAGRTSAARVQSPCGCLFGRLCKRRLRLRRGDARGEAPCIRKLKISPFPGGEGGRGDGGKKKAKGRSGGRQGRQAPLQAPQWQVEQVPRGFSPPAGACSAGSVSAASGLMPGCRGRSPRRNKLKIPPSRREGGRGDGGRKANQRQERRATKKASPPSGTTVARIASAARVQPPTGCRVGRANQCRPGSAPRRVPRRQEL